MWLGWFRPPYSSVVLRRLPTVRWPSLDYGLTRSLSLLRLFGPFLGALLSELSSFFTFWSPLGSPFRSVVLSLGFSFLLVVCSCLLSAVDRLFSSGSPRLWRPSVVRGALHRVVLVLCRRFVSVRLLSFLPLLLLRCLAAW